MFWQRDGWVWANGKRVVSTSFFPLLPVACCLLTAISGTVELAIIRPAVAQTVGEVPAIAQQQFEGKQSLCPADLAAKIETIINRPQWQRSQWGILVQTLDSGATLYQLQAEKYFTSASTAKLLTAAAILQKFGGEFRIRTPVYATGTVPNLQTLRIAGRGDPSLTTEKLTELARQLKQQGVHKIATLIVDDSYLKTAPINPTWEWGDIPFYYATPVNSLILNENAVTLKLLPVVLGAPLKVEWSDPIAARQWQVINQAIATIKGTPYSIEIISKFGKPVLDISGKLAIDSAPDTFSLAIPEPSKYFLETLQSLLSEQGIIVGQAIVIEHDFNHKNEREIIFIESDKLAEILKKMNQESNNLYAEAMRNILITESQTTVENEALQKQLSVLEINPKSYNLVDGSGLSRQNLITPAALVQTLRLIAKTPAAKTYRDSLAVAGVSGTLQKRFQNSAVSGNLQGKTGTLTGVAALAGYLQITNFQPLVFSMIVNQSDVPAADLRKAIDEIVRLLSRLNNTCHAKSI